MSKLLLFRLKYSLALIRDSSYNEFYYNFIRRSGPKTMNFFFRIFIAIFFCTLSGSVLGQTTNNNCANASPFCTGQTMNFPATTNVPNSQTGPNYGCLGSQP